MNTDISGNPEGIAYTFQHFDGIHLLCLYCKDDHCSYYVKTVKPVKSIAIFLNYGSLWQNT